VGYLRERVHLENPGVDEKVILIWIFRKWDGGMDWIDLAQNRDRAGTCKRPNDPSGSKKGGEFLY